MPSQSRIGDRAPWNSEAGHASVCTATVHTSDFGRKGHTHRASSENPQGEIKSDKTDPIAAHKGAVLKKVA